MKLIVAAFLEIAGICGVAAGLWMLAPWLGVAAGGVGLVLCGLAVDPPRRTQVDP
jgi:hypothetical protein